VSPRAYRLLFWVALLLLVVVALGALRSILLPFAVGLVVAYILAPTVGRLERWGVSRTLASLFVLAVFLFGVACIFILLVPLIEGQIVKLIARTPYLVALMQEQVGNLMQLLQERLPAEEVAKLRDLLGTKLGEALTWIVAILQGMITSSFAVLNILSLIVVTPIVAFFLLRDWQAIVGYIDSYVPRQSLATVREQAHIVSDTLVGFVHGQALVCLILAIYYAIALSIVGLESAVALGFLIGILAIIPIAGVTMALILSLGLAALQCGQWAQVFMVAGVFAFGQTIEGYVLTPKLIGDRIHLHPVWVIFALFAGGTLAGFVGVLVAVPAAAVIGVLIRFALQRYRQSTLYDSRDAAPEPVRRRSRV